MSNPEPLSPPLFPLDELELPWKMSRAERYAMESLVRTSKPEVAIEVGTHLGGSLQLLAKHSQKVYSIDTDPQCASSLREKFPNVDFRTGRSKDLLPQVLEEIRNRDESLGMVLIDGDHSEAAVRSDIEATLTHIPTRRCLVAMHDSFNPSVRRGILNSPWTSNPYVHFLELDFVTGTMFKTNVSSSAGYDTTGSMWGGLAMAILLPEKRNGDLEIRQFNEMIFEASFLESRYPSRRERLHRVLRTAAQSIHSSFSKFSSPNNGC